MMDAASDELDELYRKHPDAFSAIPQCDNNDVWCHYRLFKEDAYMVSYLEHLDAEVSELIVSGIL